MLRLFDYHCGNCQTTTERIVNVSINELPHCLRCGQSLDRLPVKVRINMGPCGAHGYFDETLGSYVGTNRQRKELMREQGVTEKGASVKPDGDAWV